MITAEDAWSISDSSIRAKFNDELIGVEQAIKDAAAAGLFETSVNTLSEYVKGDLIDNGFSIVANDDGTYLIAWD